METVNLGKQCSTCAGCHDFSREDMPEIFALINNLSCDNKYMFTMLHIILLKMCRSYKCIV